MRQLKVSNETLVSIVVPTFNRPERIPEVIKTVKNQHFENWELIVVDDNPPESNARLLTKKNIEPFITTNIRYIELTRNCGACEARNRGAREAEGDYIAFLDDDDLWEPQKLSLQIQCFKEDPTLDFLICGVHQLGYGTSQTFEFKFKGPFFDYFLNVGYGVCCSAMMVKKASFLDIGGFDPDQPSYQDLDLILRITKNGKAKVLPNVLITYNLGEDGITRNPMKKIRGIQRLMENYQFELSSKAFANGKQKLLTSLGDFSLLGSKRKLAIQSYFKAIFVQPPELKLVIKFILSFFVTSGVCRKWVNRHNLEAK